MCPPYHHILLQYSNHSVSPTPLSAHLHQAPRANQLALADAQHHLEPALPLEVQACLEEPLAQRWWTAFLCPHFLQQVGEGTLEPKSKTHVQIQLTPCRRPVVLKNKYDTNNVITNLGQVTKGTNRER